MIAFVAGILIALITIYGIKFSKTETTPWAYPITLSLYPMFYFGFAIYKNEIPVLINELIFAMPFFAICLVSALKNIKYSGYILSAGYIGHGVYDVIHDQLFINPGMPEYWPIFCGTIDIIIGVYLIFISYKLPNKTLVQYAKIT